MTLKQRVEATGIKKSKLARMLNASNSQVTEWLNGTRTMPEEVRAHLVRIVSRLEEALK